MTCYLEKALEIKDEIIKNRREIHQNPELGFNLEKTIALVVDRLESYGYEPKIVGKAGVTATVGSGSPVILLRGDMDALPMDETTGLEFASCNGATHSCGHDGHTSMLLGAARILKQNEANLKGTVKFMFQPAEEILGGALDMIENGILENPKVDAAVALHLYAGDTESRMGDIYLSRGQAMSSADAFNIKVKGKNSHGSRPEEGIDAIIVACNIVIGLQTILAREISMFDSCVVLAGKIYGGDTVNTTSGHATVEVSARANNEESRDFIIKRIKEISEGIAQTYRAEVEIEHTMGAPSMFNDVDLVDDIVEFSKDIIGEEKINVVPMKSGTEDFAYVGLKVPAVMINIGAGTIEDGYIHGMHNAGMQFNEDVLPLGSSLYADVATKYLEKYSK